MQKLCNVSLGVVARPQSNKVVCYDLNFVNKHLNSSEAMSVKFVLRIIAEKTFY